MIISKELLEIYFNILNTQLNTGLDKVTPSKFNSIRSKEFEVILNKIQTRTYKFTRLKSISLASGREVYTPTIRDRLVLEILKDNLNKKYKINYVNRNEIIKSIINKLQSETDFFIIRLDIKNFFPSIPQNRLLQKLRDNALLSSQEYFLVKECLKLVPNGVPQGLSISNVLAEIYLEGLDYKLKRIHPRTNYYCRYVDDILIMLNGTLSEKEKNELEAEILRVFKAYNLYSNTEKQQFVSVLNISQRKSVFEYLGYKFVSQNKKKMVHISEKKINRIKTKIDYTFWDFKRNKCLGLLLQRLDFLLSKNIIIKRERIINKNNQTAIKTQKVYFGVIESYKHIETSYWTELDIYLKQKLQMIIHLINDRNTKKILHSLSFVNNFKTNKCLKIYKFDKREYIKRLISMDKLLNASALSGESISLLSKRYFDLLNL